MEKNKKNHMVLEMILALCILAIIGLTGCAVKEDNAGTAQDISFPSFKYLLEEEDQVSSSRPAESAVVPVKVYFDNTGSMEGFTIDKDGKRKPCSLYSKLMRCLRDMGRMQTIEYYVLGVNEQDWVLYEESIYDNFYTEGFHVWWKSGQPGPLSKLYMNNRINDQCVNIVLTDLAEQRLNNTQLAEQIQKLCDEKDCEADLYAFKFDFNGATQVPDPNAASGMLEQMVHDEKPYYMIITGKTDYMQKYRNELKTLFNDAGMEEGKDFFWATNQSVVQKKTLTMADIVFEPFAGYEQIFMEYENSRKAEKAKEDSTDEDAGSELKTYSKNLCQYEDTGQLCPGIEFAAFYYQKVEGVSKKQGDWRLNFYIPLNNWGDSRTEYTYDYHIYKLEQIQAETEADTGQQDNFMQNWVEDANSRMELSVEICEDFKRDDYHSAVLYVTCKDKEVEKKSEPREQELLLILDVTKEETYFYERPDWLDAFDTGSTDDYFTRTFNLNGFYDVLFGNKNKISGDGAVHIRSNYVQVPILLTGLKE